MNIMHNNEKVVITGMGIVSPLGSNLEEYWGNLRDGVVNFGNIDFSHLGITDIPVYKAHFVSKKKPAGCIPLNTKKKMDDSVAYSLIATKEAVQDAILYDVILNNPERVGVVLGSTFGGIGYAEKEYLRYMSYEEKKIFPRVSAYLSIAMFSCAAPGQVSVSHNFKGKIYSIPDGNTSGIDSMFYAIRALNSGSVDVMLAGSFEAPITPFCISSLFSLGKLKKESSENFCCSPFSGKNEGFLLGEGSGVLSLEREDFARKRGAKIYGRIVNYQSVINSNIISAGERCLASLFKSGGIGINEIDFIVAYGDGTQTDQKEIEVLKRVFGKALTTIPITAIKPITGHALSASSSFEIIAGVLSLKKNVIIPIRGVQNMSLIEETKVCYAKNIEKHKLLKTFLIYCIGFNGKYSAIIVRKVSE